MLAHKLLGDSWGKVLAPLMPDEFLDNIGAQIAQERKISTVYPARENVFRAFHMTPFEEVLVVAIGQDPYNNMDGQATGLAMDCGVRSSPTIAKILEVYNDEFPNAFPAHLYDGDLKPWAKQGVFLINTALTVRKNQPQSHLKIWQKFTITVLDALKASQNPKAFLVMGNDAKKLVPTVPAPHYGFYYEHPVAAAYAERKWNAPGVFTNINKFLMDYRGTKIDW